MGEHRYQDLGPCPFGIYNEKEQGKEKMGEEKENTKFGEARELERWAWRGVREEMKEERANSVISSNIMTGFCLSGRHRKQGQGMEL